MRLLLVIVLVLGTIRGAAQQAANLLNGVVAIVNSKVITWEDVRKYSLQEEDLLYRQYRLQPTLLQQKIEQLRRDAVEMLIERQLILFEFETSGFKLPEAFIEDAIKRDIRDNYGDRLRLTKTLQSQGITTETYRQRVRERIIVSALTAKNVASEILISPYKIERHYATNLAEFKLPDRVKLRILTLDKRKHGEEGARNLAKEILALMEQGADFGELAGVYSDDPQRREGGARGWEERTSLRSDLSEVAFSLKAGQRSGVIDKPEGCYLMLVEEVSPAHIQPLTEVRERIETDLVAAEQKRLRQQWINKLRAKQFVRYLPGL
jgi:peptidyl-prolyl cis-trans isomerase SurA